MQDVIVIKLGGVASDNLTETFFKQISAWQKEGKKIVVVHGGGHYISEMMERLKLSVQIKAGLRVTTEEALTITKMVLLGQVQPMITAYFQQAGFSVVGLNASSSQLITGEYIDQHTLGAVGEVVEIDTGLLDDLLSMAHLPVVAPLGLTKAGEWLNINADHVACKIAEAMEAEALYLLTDVPGVKKADTWLKQLTPVEITQLKAMDVIKGGMLPKIESAQTAIESGVKKVHITNQINKAGTIIRKEEVQV
jgi:acetylglutamate kinase